MNIKANKFEKEEKRAEEVIPKKMVTKGKVIRGELNFRKSPDITFNLIRYLKDGEVVEVIEEGADTLWYKVKDSNGVVGYVMKEFLLTYVEEV